MKSGSLRVHLTILKNFEKIESKNISGEILLVKRDMKKKKKKIDIYLFEVMRKS